MVEQDKINPCLWFDNQAEEAANFYVSVFREARILTISRISAGPAEGNALVEFELYGHKFTALDGGPLFKFTPAISFVVKCESQEEIDYYWDKAGSGWQHQSVWLARGPVWHFVAGAAGDPTRADGEGTPRESWRRC